MEPQIQSLHQHRTTIHIRPKNPNKTTALWTNKVIQPRHQRTMPRNLQNQRTSQPTKQFPTTKHAKYRIFSNMGNRYRMQFAKNPKNFKRKS